MVVFGRTRKALIWQSECVHRVSTGTYNVLFPVYSVTDWATRIGTAQVHVPKRLAGCRIECHKVAVHPTSEHQASGGGKHATLRVIDHLEVPLLLAGFRIDGTDCTVPLGLRLVIRTGTPFCAGSAGLGRSGRPVRRGRRFPKAGPPTVS